MCFAGFGAYLTTPLDVIKTRLQVQGSTTRYTANLTLVIDTRVCFSAGQLDIYLMHIDIFLLPIFLLTSRIIRSLHHCDKHHFPFDSMWFVSWATKFLLFCKTIRYNGWLDAIKKTWDSEGVNGLFRGSVPRIIWYIPASALTFMAVEFLREHFNVKTDTDAETALN